MKIGKKFNQLTLKEYLFYIDNYKKYTDFNTLGLYRSILENKNLSIADKLEVRDYANKTFKKTFLFLQLKDPKTYFDIITLGQEITRGDEQKIWSDIITSQQAILTEKKIKHRNFGIYSKHNCGYDTCPLNGLMIKRGSFMEESHMWFTADKNRYSVKSKAEKRKADRKKEKQVIRKLLDGE